MTHIKQADLIESVAAALQYISYSTRLTTSPTWPALTSVSKARVPRTPLRKS